MNYTWDEYGVIVSEGPHRGILLKTFRKLENAQAYIAAPPDYARYGSLRLATRQVTATDWADL